ncbi:MAG: MBL fold metallo-hydrolase, partial [Psychrosphaera sp.]|nr:MBL fold metallo-hydrolase [Psychrosphaera sp.]
SFPFATWLVHKKEVEAMFAKRNAQKRFADFIHLKRMTFTGDHDVFGDGSVVILQMPGHTPGHTALKVILAKTGPVLISGDLYHQAKSRRLKRVPSFNDNEAQTRESMARFEKMAIELGAKVIIQHEQVDVAKLPALPGFLD